MRRATRAAWLVSGLLLARASVGWGAVETWFDAAGGLWKLGPDEFIAARHTDGFRWVSDQREAARSADPSLRFLDQRVWEAIAQFEAGRVASVTLSLYNRGDAGELAPAAFEKLLGDLNGGLNRWAGAAGVQLQDETLTAAITVRRRAWVNGPHTVAMIWSFTARSRAQGAAATRPEYVRLKWTPFDPARDPRKLRFAPVSRGADPLVNTLELRARAQRQVNGDVVIASVPMVDQGQKGYCAAAVAERLLRYYGRNVDQHEIAQLANTDAAGGTAPDQLVRVLRRVGGKLGLDVHVHADFNRNDFQRLVADYNRLAKRAGRPEISYGRVIDVGEVYRAFESALLMEARGRRDAARDKFRADIQRAVTAGVPLAWAVMLGKVAEQPPAPMGGGHLRLIIGYNDRADEVLFSDTWGRGHELKRMPLAEAWAITLGLHAVHPPSVRF